MKRIIFGLTALVLLAIVMVGALVLITFMGRRSVSDGREIGDVRIVADGISSFGVVPVGDREVLLIDAGQDPAGAAVLAELERRGLSVDAVRAVFLTHGHQDHVAAIPLLPRAEVLALSAETALVEGRVGSSGPMTRFFPVSPTGITVTRGLQDGETVVIGDRPVRAFAMPGHTAGSAAYLVAGVLFVGDSADVNSDGEIQGAPWIFSDSQTQNRASLVRLADRLAGQPGEVRAIVPAHSGAVDGLEPLLTFARAQGPSSAQSSGTTR